MAVLMTRWVGEKVRDPSASLRMTKGKCLALTALAMIAFAGNSLLCRQALSTISTRSPSIVILSRSKDL